MYSYFRDATGALYAWEADIFGVPPAFFQIPAASRQMFQATFGGQNFLWNLLQGPAPFNVILPLGQAAPGEVPVVLSRAEQQKSTPVAPKLPPPLVPTNIQVPLTNRPPIVVNPSVFNTGPQSNPTGINAPNGVFVSPFSPRPGAIPISNISPTPGVNDFPPIQFPRPVRVPGPAVTPPPGGVNSTNPGVVDVTPAAPSFLGHLTSLAIATSPAWATLLYLHYYGKR